MSAESETRSLIAHLEQSPDWTLIGANDGESPTLWLGEGEHTVEDLIEEVTAADEGNLFYRITDGPRVRLFLVFGNSPGELVADGTCPAGSESLWAAIHEWSDSQQIAAGY